MNLDLLVPDIGDFENVEIIEVLVNSYEVLAINNEIKPTEKIKANNTKNFGLMIFLKNNK